MRSVGRTPSRASSTSAVELLEGGLANARTLGATEVDDAMVDLVIERWITTGDFHEGLYGFT
jgi:hypothetical protein